MIHSPIGAISFILLIAIACHGNWAFSQMRAGIGKIDITDRAAGPVNDPLYAKAIVFEVDKKRVVIASVDAVAIGEIGYIKNDFMKTVREQLQSRWQIDPTDFFVNASHCHGVVRADADACMVEAVGLAIANLQEVRLGLGSGSENRISENRRLLLANGKTADVRHAYALPPDEQVAGVGPIDPEIGVLRVDRADGSVLAVLYNFAMHPIQGVPSGANTADIIGFASKVIEDSTGPESMAIFLQGCGGDINPVLYKDVEHPRNAEPLGQMLGLSTMQAVRNIQCHPDDRLIVAHQSIPLPRADRTERIIALEAEQMRLLASLAGTSLNLKTFLPLAAKYGVHEKYPSYYSHRYLHDEKLGREDYRKLDADNRRNMEQYIRNIHIMEELTRLQTNLALLKKHQATFMADGKRTILVETAAIRIGPCVLTTFPGELTVQIGLNLKQHSPHANTWVAGYTNGYIYYAPTREQLLNPGYAQEDCDCLLAPEWQSIYEQHAVALLKEL